MIEATNLRHTEGQSLVNASAPEVFAELDDHVRLSAHMQKSSWLMLGSRMQVHLDAEGGRKVGSRIRLDGRVLGIPLTVEEVITERTPPTRKVWETIGTPRLLVIGPYRMGFEIAPAVTNTRLRVFIEYALPNGLARVLGRLLGAAYARWCVQRMLRDAVAHFSTRESTERFRAG